MNTRFKTTKFRDAGIKKLSQFYCVTFLEDTVYRLSLSSNSLPSGDTPMQINSGSPCCIQYYSRHTTVKTERKHTQNCIIKVYSNFSHTLTSIM